eukprot:13288765-Alexandrium_andersonii.AAC.1
MPRPPIQVAPRSHGKVVARGCSVEGDGCCRDRKGGLRAAHELGGGPVNEPSESALDVAVRDSHDQRPQ